MQMLARRELSRRELRHRLEAKGAEPVIAERVVAECVEHGWQSDKRYAESWVRSRGQRGMGPLLIIRELEHQGIDREIIGQAVDSKASEWQERLRSLIDKRLRSRPCTGSIARAKLVRFLQARGFALEQILNTIDGLQLD